MFRIKVYGLEYFKYTNLNYTHIHLQQSWNKKIQEKLHQVEVGKYLRKSPTKTSNKFMAPSKESWLDSWNQYREYTL